MKKSDIILVVSVVLLAVVVFFAFFKLPFKDGKTVRISKNNEIVYEGSLSEDKTIDLKGNIVEIKNGKVKVRKATCKNQVCVNKGEISKEGENIVCLPNKVIIEIR